MKNIAKKKDKKKRSEYQQLGPRPLYFPHMFDYNTPVLPWLCGLFRFLCCVFCCPPYPSWIAEKLAFLPPEPNYEIVIDEMTGEECIFSILNESPYATVSLVPGPANPNLMKAKYVHTSSGNRIVTLHIKSSGLPNGPKRTILFSHGNAAQLSDLPLDLIALGPILKCDFFCYDYSGYGQSTGKPSEANLHSDIRAAFECLVKDYDLQPSDVILWGQSIGSVPTISLASEFPVAGVIVEGAFLSALKYAGLKKLCCGDIFRNFKKISEITSPTLMIHSIQDDVVPFDHAEELYNLCQNPVEPLWLSGEHNQYSNDSMKRRKNRLASFINLEISAE